MEDRRFSREVERICLKKNIEKSDRYLQMRRESEELEHMGVSRGGNRPKQHIEWPQNAKDRSARIAYEGAILRQRRHNLHMLQNEENRLERLRWKLEQNLKAERESPRLDKQLVDEAKLMLEQELNKS